MTEKKKIKNSVGGSFRDPSGVLFWYKDVLYRGINSSYSEDFEFFINSGLYKELSEKNLIVKHTEAEKNDNFYKVIKPDLIPFISFPYEWSFSQLKDAALLTLKIQKASILKGMSLKDASAYNVQFINHRPIFIDTLSFEKHKEGNPWIAYRQFCQHFLAPLSLMSFKDARLGQLLRVHIDGIPLDLASKLLPRKTYAKPSILMHIHTHARFQKRYEDTDNNVKGRGISTKGLKSLLENLTRIVDGMALDTSKTQWGDYYEDTNYSGESFKNKKEIVEVFLKNNTQQTIVDYGANTGVFSAIASKYSDGVISVDMDHAAVEKNYKNVKKNRDNKTLPLLLDLANPSPALGWENTERDSFVQRAKADTALALALIHHLSIANNLPFDMVARFFSRVCQNLIIEFVPKNDSNAQRLLRAREDIFEDYTQKNFETEFGKYFKIENCKKIKGTQRFLYYMIKI